MTRVAVDSPDDLHWIVSRPLLPEWMRPGGLAAVGGAVGPPDGMSIARTQLGLPALVLGLLLTVVSLPLVPFVVALRRLGLVPWTLQAVARPWGRRGPPMVLAYAVRGRADTVDRVEAELVERLRLGDGAPVLRGAERVR